MKCPACGYTFSHHYTEVSFLVAEWKALGAETRLAHSMSRSGISPTDARNMSDEQLSFARNVGRKSLMKLQSLLG